LADRAADSLEQGCAGSALTRAAALDTLTGGAPASISDPRSAGATHEQ
jgi:hypothetical protein